MCLLEFHLKWNAKIFEGFSVKLTLFLAIVPDLKYPAFLRNLRKKTERTEFLMAISGSMSPTWVIKFARAL